MLKNRTTKEMTTIIAIREKSNGGDVLAYDDTYLANGSIDLKAMIDSGEFGDNFHYYTREDEEFLPDAFCYHDEFKMLEDDEFITSDGDIYKESEPITFFSYDLVHYEVVEFNSEDEIVDEFNKLGVSEKIGKNFLMWFYNGDETIEFGYHDGSEYMEWFVCADDTEDDDD